MKNLILLTCLAMFTFSGFATVLFLQSEPNPEKASAFVGILQFFLPAIISSIFVLFSDASKWWSTGLWDWSVFRDSKIKPFLISLVVAVAIYLLLTYAPFLKPILEGMADYNITEVTAVALMGMATALIDNFLKKPPTEEEQELFMRTREDNL